MKNNNKIIIFDWGGVIESHYEGEYNCDNAILGIMKSFDVSLNEKEKINKFISCYNDEFNICIGECNKIEDIEKWFYRIKKEFNLNCNFEEFCKIYIKEFSKVYFYKDVVELAHSLKDKCKIGILSNLMYLDKERIDKQVDLKQFDYVWLSFEIGYIKPNEKIYEFVEKECKIKPENILFIDDAQKNIIKAKQKGWNTCQATGHQIDKIKNAINDFLNNDL